MAAGSRPDGGRAFTAPPGVWMKPHPAPWVREAGIRFIEGFKRATWSDVKEEVAMHINGITVRGVDVDAQTRCRHYHTEKDIIAIKFRCCNTYYPCYQCHEALADHPIEVWKKEEFEEKAILCGNCATELSIHEYLACRSVCPHCGAHFNPGCADHYALYFER